MADSTLTDLNKMKVIDLRKELKSRGLRSTGDKAELVSKLQAAMSQDSQDEHADINLDSDEIDSDGVLDEDDKCQNDILDDAVDTLNEELALAEQPPTTIKSTTEKKPPRTLKRKITMSDPVKGIDLKTAENKEIGGKKIILNRATSVNTVTSQPAPEKTEDKPIKTDSAPNTNKVKITADLDPKIKLELRAKRFGLPVKMTENERKAARKHRFGQNTTSTIDTAAGLPGTLTENLEKLKKRAERFGQSVSKVMNDIEIKEKLEKRRAKFGTAK